MSAGFEDYQRIVRWFGVPVLDEAIAYAGVDVVRGPFRVPSYKSLLLFINPVGGNAKVLVNSRPSSAIAGITRFQTVYAEAGRSVVMVVPLPGDVVDSIVVTGAANPQTVQLVAVPTNLDAWARNAGAFGRMTYLRNFGLGIAANVVQTQPPFTGRAHLTFASSAYPCAVSVKGLDHLGAEQAILWEHLAVAAPVNDSLVLTPTINEIVVVNNSGVAITFNLGINGDLS